MSRARLTLAWLAILLVGDASPALADNCRSLSDCFDGNVVPALLLLAGLVLLVAAAWYLAPLLARFAMSTATRTMLASAGRSRIAAGVVRSPAVRGMARSRLGPARGAANLLEARDATAFMGNVRRIVLQADKVEYRYSSAVSDPVGKWLTTRATIKRIGALRNAKKALKLPAKAEALHAFVIPRGTEIFVGRVAGGARWATQIFIREKTVLVPFK